MAKEHWGVGTLELGFDNRTMPRTSGTGRVQFHGGSMIIAADVLKSARGQPVHHGLVKPDTSAYLHGRLGCYDLSHQDVSGYGWKGRANKVFRLTVAKVSVMDDGKEEMVVATTTKKKRFRDGASQSSRLKDLKR